MFRGRSVAVVIPALDEEGTIGSVVRDFLAQPSVDRVLVVDNASRDRTAERARSAGAEVVREERPGYGQALRAGLERAVESGAELLVLSEADGTFAAAEIERLLEPTAQFPLVLGSRTRSMRPHHPLRLGNVLVAKLLSGLWFRSSPRLSDVGCTYRALTAEAWRRLGRGTRTPGPEFSPEMICAAFILGLRTVEVPVSYRARESGASKHSASFLAASRTALRMLRTILGRRLGERSPG